MGCSPGVAGLVGLAILLGLSGLAACNQATTIQAATVMITQAALEDGIHRFDLKTTLEDLVINYKVRTRLSLSM